MAEITIKIPKQADVAGKAPIVILGPNGSGKTKLAQGISASNKVTAVSAQMRTWLDDQLPVDTADRVKNHVQNQQDHWRSRSWQPTEEINQLLSTLIQEHSSLLSTRNEEAIASETPLQPVTNTKL